MSSGMFRGKESSNRIEISRLVQDLLNFGVFGSLRLWGGGRWVGGCLVGSGGWQVSPHTRTWTCTHAHARKRMYRNCKWLPTWRHPCLSCLSCLTCMCVRACVRARVCACVCACDTPLHTHAHPHPHLPIRHPPRGWDPRNQSKFNRT